MTITFAPSSKVQTIEVTPEDLSALIKLLDDLIKVMASDPSAPQALAALINTIMDTINNTAAPGPR